MTGSSSEATAGSSGRVIGFWGCCGLSSGIMVKDYSNIEAKAIQRFSRRLNGGI